MERGEVRGREEILGERGDFRGEFREERRFYGRKEILWEKGDFMRVRRG